MINYDGRRFRPAEPEAEGRTAVYRQEGDLLWGTFSGGRARHGTLAGVCAPDGTLDFAYSMVLEDGEIVCGRCHSEPELREDGGVDLREEWERYGGHAAVGVSYLREIK
ncbi:hypothetical protein ACF06X_20275 [Streptomyces sp. NPDC015346]|uniref:hypothetical protein n=1 Tax=Streptomyces sp. NPDC015346 TaxID=3364954 RepID=UPI0036F7EADA